MATAFTWALTAAGAALVFIYKNVSESAFSFMMSSAAGIMLASTFFSLLMPAMEMAPDYSYLILTCGFVLGGALIIVTDILIGKLKLFSGSDNANKRSCAVMCIAVTMHNIPEGLAVGVAFGALASGQTAGAVAAVMLAVGIGIQNFPEGMCVAFPLRANGFSRTKSFLIGQLSGAVEIVAGVIGALAVQAVNGILPWALSFSAGAMLAVVCSELIPESFAQGKIKATIGVIFGFALMMILDIAFG
ncbi:MAG: ZIP family metal transporter [Clostridia bacterium]|nr:ZIP family metal transporter [Clostridia bacterium]MDE6356907.1 ZIP family metal transporter [Clostridia bacterium]